ncbi:AAA family ATPase [Vibrio makurazakiensis]|uniref:ExeA family protein n=1 Tax=Vibrio makurazakiensis TaxID=2910250 RepID=UPI003D14B6FB
MYKEYFGFVEMPFSIVPNSRYLFLSQRHQEAMQNLQAGLGEGGGFAMLTGEVGTGKTTVAKAMMAELDEQTIAGLILNPTFSSSDLLEAICDEFEIEYPYQPSLKELNQAIYQYLLDKNEQGIQTLLVIDEAQHLAADVLEQLRLLTNLETDNRKLLKVLLVGQPELQQHLQTTQLRQLAQRITGRYHLLPLNASETRQYIDFRLDTAGGAVGLFSNRCVKIIAQQTHGIPRLINLVCDKALQLSFHEGKAKLDTAIVARACQQVMSFQASVYQTDSPSSLFGSKSISYAIAGCLGLGIALVGYWSIPHFLSDSSTNPVVVQSSEQQHSNYQTSAPKLEKSQLDSFSGLSTQAVQFLENAKSKTTSVQNLYQLWGYQPSIRDGLCLTEPQSIFACDSSYSTLSELIQRDMPVVMHLNIQGESSYVVLYSANDTEVELLANGRLLRLPREQVEHLWKGEYYSIWQQPLRETLKQGVQGEAVVMLDILLSEVLNENVLGNDIYDGEIKLKVEAFQSWQGMSVDGIAGQNTLTRLQKLAQLDAPKLQPLLEESY